MRSVSILIMYLYIDEEMLYWLMTHDSDWKLSREATDALYSEYFDGCHCYQDEIYNEYHTAIDLTVSELFDKFEDKFESEDDVLEFLEEESSIVIDDIEYEIDISFENNDRETTFILKPMNNNEDF